MKINNISFITPLKDEKKYTLKSNYSNTLTLPNGTSINFASNIGPRSNQQDSIAITLNNDYLLLLVADGMGGLEQGEAASHIVAEVMKTWLETKKEEELKNINEENLRSSFPIIFKLVRERLLPNNAGTTLNMSIIGPENTIIINIGDSRTYSIKNNQITLETIDDSLAFENYDISKPEYRDLLRFYKNNNIITNCISKRTRPILHIKTIKNSQYDILCHLTDGISDVLSEQEIKELLLCKKPAESLVLSSVKSSPKYNDCDIAGFDTCISPKDNSSAIVYTKKRIK